MPFRSNAFGEQIAQPGTSHGEIENALSAKTFYNDFDIHGADLYTNGDDDFKFGGTLHISIMIESDEIDEDGEPEEPDYHDVTMEFDGFETFEDAKAWLSGLYPDIKPIEVA